MTPTTLQRLVDTARSGLEIRLSPAPTPGALLLHARRGDLTTAQLLTADDLDHRVGPEIAIAYTLDLMLNALDAHQGEGERPDPQ